MTTCHDGSNSAGVWQLFAIVWTGIMACVVIESSVHDGGHLGTGTLKHLAFYSLFMAASVTVGVQLATTGQSPATTRRKPWPVSPLSSRSTKASRSPQPERMTE